MKSMVLRMEVRLLFSYVDKQIKGRLEGDGRLIYLDQEGKPVPADMESKSFISLMGPIPIPRKIGDKTVTFNWYPFVRRVELRHVLNCARQVSAGGEEAFRALLQNNMSVNSVLATQNFKDLANPLVRVHSCCMTGDVFGSMRCECGPQLNESFARVADEGGAIVYMSGHEGRGIGMWAKAVTYMLQDEGQDTYQANVSLGLPEDSRDFADAAIALKYLLGGKPIRLLSNNPLKLKHLVSNGQPVSETVSLVTGINDHNITYLRSKRSKGHNLPEI